MNNDSEEPRGEEGGRFHILQPLRDPQSNWAVDLAKNLEEYLLKICSGEVTGDEDDNHLSVNFAEAALLLQGSIQVYSRKVEYLYGLVLHALEFLSQKRQQEQPENTSSQAGGSDSQAVDVEENEIFLGLDDVPVDAKNSLESGSTNDDNLNSFVKPPANLVVLEGDCFDSTGDAGELESYLLSTCDLYEDFILLDPCDAGEIQNFLKRDTVHKGNASRRGSSVRSKTRKSFLQSPTRIPGGTVHKSSLREKQDANLSGTPEINCNFETNDNNIYQDPPSCNPPETDYHGDEMGDAYLDPRDVSDNDTDDDDDPWKPLNPHEPGNLKVKPFKKAKTLARKKTNKHISVATQFPVARLNGTISPEFTEMWETQRSAGENPQDAESSLLYEKLRQSLIDGGNDAFNAFSNVEDDKDDEYVHGISDHEQDDCDFPTSTFMDVDVNNDKPGEGDAVQFESTDIGEDNHDSNANLEDLCRSHLDALLASIAENEKQTELATRVSTWKQRIEQTLEDQDSRPPFDIHEYGERVLNKLSLEADGDGVMSFTNVVSGHEKHDVARAFSALLQLVNNGNVDLVRGEPEGQSICYTSASPFHVQLLNHDRRREVQLRSSKKRMKSPLKNKSRHTDMNRCDGESSSGFASSLRTCQSNGKFSVKLGKVSAVRCTPEGKRRRRSRLIEPVDLQSAG